MGGYIRKAAVGIVLWDPHTTVTGGRAPGNRTGVVALPSNVGYTLDDTPKLLDFGVGTDGPGHPAGSRNRQQK
jgi:hypothetical protein